MIVVDNPRMSVQSITLRSLEKRFYSAIRTTRQRCKKYFKTLENL